jgi:hypothetical protein
LCRVSWVGLLAAVIVLLACDTLTAAGRGIRCVGLHLDIG